MRPLHRRFDPRGTRFRVDAAVAALDRLTLVRSEMGTETEIIGAPAPGTRALAFLPRPRSDATALGHPMDGSMLLSQDQAEWSSQTSPGNRFVYVAFQPDVVAAHAATVWGDSERFWLPDEQLVAARASADRGQLCEVLDTVWSWLDGLSSAEIPKAAGREIEERVLDSLVQVFSAPRSIATEFRSESTRRNAFEAALAHAEQRDPRGVTVSSLCRVAAVSRRTLEYGFRAALGFGPARFLRERRFEGVRRDLLRADPQTTGVRHVALEWGFLDMGHFAGDYRKRFSELPSVTLRRA